MADKEFRLHVLTQEKAVIDRQVVSVIAPGTEGYLGIWKDHAPLVTALQPGKLSIKPDPDHEIDYAIAGGYLEVSGNRVTILTDSLEEIAQIDLDRAHAALERAHKQLESMDSELDAAAAEHALQRAKNRVRLAKLKNR